jgi:hypothetical protein
MKAESIIYSVNIGVSPKNAGAFTAKKSSPFYDKTQKGVLLDNSDTFSCDDCRKLLQNETDLVVREVDLYYGFTFTVEIESHLEIPAVREKLEQFVEKYFDEYNPKA